MRRTRRWAAFYGAEADAGSFADFDTVVLDPGYRGALDAITAGGASTFGYLSLGEIRTTGPLFGLVRDASLVLDENPEWPGARAVDMRHPEWARLILRHAVPAIVERGFGGLFLDTLDRPSDLQAREPRRFAGMDDAAVHLVRAIRRTWPGLPLIMNRGYALLPRLVDGLEAVVAESLLSTYDFAAKQYAWVAPDVAARQLELLQPARRRGVPILSLDYWDTDDTATVRTIARRERALGHVPYVSTILLDRVPSVRF